MRSVSPPPLSIACCRLKHAAPYQASHVASRFTSPASARSTALLEASQTLVLLMLLNLLPRRPRLRSISATQRRLVRQTLKTELVSLACGLLRIEPPVAHNRVQSIVPESQLRRERALQIVRPDQTDRLTASLGVEHHLRVLGDPAVFAVRTTMKHPIARGPRRDTACRSDSSPPDMTHE